MAKGRPRAGDSVRKVIKLRYRNGKTKEILDTEYDRRRIMDDPDIVSALAFDRPVPQGAEADRLTGVIKRPVD